MILKASGQYVRATSLGIDTERMVSDTHPSDAAHQIHADILRPDSPSRERMSNAQDLWISVGEAAQRAYLPE
ncbi:hypothetical protein GR925_02930 [Streptomyces sp. HUCO-GS316]|uniref:hypothetical protein n=1 Tax=Streptomyces sp. HUCO-GS316 TaxID=2692198 RepID=UPI0013721BEC|nr:hypothetical protein [Streptomyces sp. HUCO-GS316]MXM62428.1 hypothetical protein [Streptomyces sp. HUCO-GS316]